MVPPRSVNGWGKSFFASIVTLPLSVPQKPTFCTHPHVDELGELLQKCRDMPSLDMLSGENSMDLEAAMVGGLLLVTCVTIVGNILLQLLITGVTIISNVCSYY